MTHHGFTYQEGLNKDTQAFDPNPTCEDGLFFASKDILAFLEKGTLIAEVEVPENEKFVQVTVGQTQKFKARKIILTNIRPLTSEMLQMLIAEGADIHAGNDYALLWSAVNGHLEGVKYLVEQGADIHADDDYALRWSACNGHLEVVKYLVEQGADIHAKNDDAIWLSERYGHMEIVKYLKEQGSK